MRASAGRTDESVFFQAMPVFWLRDESLADSANLPDPGVIAEEILEDLRTR